MKIPGFLHADQPVKTHLFHWTKETDFTNVKESMVRWKCAFWFANWTLFRGKKVCLCVWAHMFKNKVCFYIKLYKVQLCTLYININIFIYIHIFIYIYMYSYIYCIKPVIHYTSFCLPHKAILFLFCTIIWFNKMKNVILMNDFFEETVGKMYFLHFYF